MSKLLSVALTRCFSYAQADVDNAVRQVFESVGFAPAFGSRILVKPNLLKAEPGGLCCTHPEIVRAACAYLLDCGCRVTVGDSPAFGSAGRVAEGIGLAERLAPLDVPIITLDQPKPVRLPFGMTIGISRFALEADAILSVPRVKVHSQMRVTCAVKNLFGCVSGVRKALAHSTHGDKGRAFKALLVEVAGALPPTAALVDGIVAMDGTGPSGGDAFPLGVVAASQSPVAVDTAIYMLLGAAPDTIPLWNELRLRETFGAGPDQLVFPLLAPSAIDVPGFRLPPVLAPESFHPLRLMKSAVKRVWMRLVH